MIRHKRIVIPRTISHSIYTKRPDTLGLRSSSIQQRKPRSHAVFQRLLWIIQVFLRILMYSVGSNVMHCGITWQLPLFAHGISFGDLLELV